MFDFYDIPEDESGEWDEDRCLEYREALWQAFVESPEAATAEEQFGQLGWTPIFLDYAFSYVGAAPPRMTRGDLNEILFELFPRKVSTEPDSAAAIVGELRAFFQFLQREYAAPNAEELLQELTDEAVRELEEALDDPAKFGMAKSMVMQGRAAGFDMSSQEGLAEFMQAYSASLARNPNVTQHSAHGPDSQHLSAQQRRQQDQQRRKKLNKKKRR
ncbi:hypothetical protein [Roseimaritima sediminicola]|uniref:hypothetical protein n=1 Tax=Roseimaritima sediminicola TaxID=2662066 RepID=UPI0012983470|nr:hypothetical protein [Roseimaritima sediminicola]